MTLRSHDLRDDATEETLDDVLNELDADAREAIRDALTGE